MGLLRLHLKLPLRQTLTTATMAMDMVMPEVMLGEPSMVILDINMVILMDIMVIMGREKQNLRLLLLLKPLLLLSLLLLLRQLLLLLLKQLLLLLLKQLLLLMLIHIILFMDIDMDLVIPMYNP